MLQAHGCFNLVEQLICRESWKGAVEGELIEPLKTARTLQREG